MGIEKGDPLIGHLLQMGRLDLAIGVGRRDVPDAKVVGQDKDDVGSFRGIRGGDRESKNEC